MKKAIKVIAILAVIGGIVLGSVGTGLLAYLGGVILATAGLIALLGKERVLYY